MESTFKAIEANIKSSKNMVNYYQTKIEEATESKARMMLEVEKLEADYEELKSKLGINETV